MKSEQDLEVWDVTRGTMPPHPFHLSVPRESGQNVLIQMNHGCGAGANVAKFPEQQPLMPNHPPRALDTDASAK